jgi:hypothetical protein
VNEHRTICLVANYGLCARSRTRRTNRHRISNFGLARQLGDVRRDPLASSLLKQSRPARSF